MKIRVNGIDVHYEISGSGPWVTLSHSLACSMGMWDEQMPALTRKYKVLRYDTRGHGATEAPQGPYTLEQMADDAHALLRALGIDRTHWVGLSMGGMIGQTFALKYPGVLASLVLADTTSRYPPAAASVWAERVKAVSEKGMEAVVEGTLARWFTEPFRASHPAVMKRIAGYIRTTPVAGYIGSCQAIPQINLTDRLNEIKCPALIIVGEQDAGTPVELARDIHAALPGSELVIIPSASHLSNIEQPQAFDAALLGFLDRVSEQTRR